MLKSLFLYGIDDIGQVKAIPHLLKKHEKSTLY